ncbi:hypothetical protein ACHHYP_00002 [Achlya hypogyna]|uniref:Secreted protein n=1 Tax=Achlya hypogyna TaxID=1202772 RepID=A0A0A7CMM2_ACHHY|nr:secreted protein [Achlya hypogyna]OQR95959.1 hypothetical protein ACHHYP_00002 [Achlya hypogyna]
MKITAAVVALATATVLANTQDGDQDLWVYTSQWSAQTCLTTFNKSTLCANPTEYLKTHFVASSLVPTYTDGTAQSGMCRYTYGTFLPTNIAPVGEKMLQQYWPYFGASNVSAMWSSANFDMENTPQYDYTCSSLGQTAYLSSIVNITKSFRVPSVIAKHIGQSVATADVRRAFRTKGSADAVLQCDGNNLARVSTCWAKGVLKSDDAEPMYFPTKRIKCPQGVAKADSCFGTHVTISKFPSTSYL